MTKELPHPFVTYLREYLLKKNAENPRFSLRAFARFLDLDASFLSKLFSGNRRPTRKIVEKIGRKLSLSQQEMNQFLEHCSPAFKKSQSRQYHSLDTDHFNLIAEWHHYAILELLALKNFEPSAQWIAGRLGLPAKTIQAAIDRLFRLGFIKRESDGRWVSANGYNTTVGQKQTNRALRQFQRQIIEKSLQALDNVPIEIRDNSAMTLAIPLKKMEKAKKLIRNFRRHFDKEMQSTREFDSVYNLVIAFYPLTLENPPKEMS